MSLLGWILFGLITGFIASKIVNRQGEGCLVNMALGLVGSVVGGLIFEFLGSRIVWGFDIRSMLVAIIGAIVVLLIYHAITGRRGLR
ncbi:MAG TPA: GlsB/YeaQ/YmgE family stress response membrane protein [Rhizomicrobium sp.]|nr:GlsB/YeaQ/YmgE family stress response membrane protein [Rhizomicrobium sp.]